MQCALFPWLPCLVGVGKHKQSSWVSLQKSEPQWFMEIISKSNKDQSMKVTVNKEISTSS